MSLRVNSQIKRQPFVAPDNPVLNQIAVPVPTGAIPTATAQSVIDAMLAIAQGEQGDAKLPTMVGLAAPQIGVGQRIIVVDVAADGLGDNRHDFRAYINPVIVFRSAATELGREGCYSTGCVCGRVRRADQIQIEALDRQGRPLSEAHKGFAARVFQHEVDHLDGTRFPDRITDDHDLLWVEKPQFGEFRRTWVTWPYHCSRERWEAIKQGRSIG